MAQTQLKPVAPVSNPNHSKFVRESFAQSLAAMQKSAMSTELQDQVCRAAEAVKAAYVGGGCLFAAGNGGSAADAQHLIAELVARLCRERSPIRAFAMNVDTSILTAIGNDYGYDEVFARQVEGLMRPEDVFLAITTSGNSPNILKALEKCREKGIPSILLSGETGGKARALATYSIQVPAPITRFVQESHAMIYHTLCEMIENDLVDAGLCQFR